MHLPEPMKQMRYAEWNHVVKGIVEVWELARLLGLEKSLEAQLQCDDGTLAQELGEMGNEFLNASHVMRRSAVAVTLAHSAYLLDALNGGPARLEADEPGQLVCAWA
jgi:hypothetical protein